MALLGTLPVQLTFLQWIGILFIFTYIFKIVSHFSHGLTTFLWWRYSGLESLKSQGQWAVITGATDGIGKAYAKRLAKQGIDTILISRNENKLRDTAKEIEEDYKVKTICIKADFGERSCYAHIKEKLEDLDIGILVNNVGVVNSILMPFNDSSEEEIWKQMTINCGAATIMCKIVIPNMIRKRKGLIVNVSSIASTWPLLETGVYSASKAYLNMFSIVLQKELEGKNIRIQCVTPFFIETNMLEPGKAFVKRFKKIFKILIPTADEYAESAVSVLCSNTLFTTGYWPHSFLGFLFSWTSISMKARILHGVMKIALNYSHQKVN